MMYALACSLVIGCKNVEEKNVWGWPRILQRAEAESLLLDAQNSAMSPHPATCIAQTDYDRSGRLVPILLAAKTGDIFDYGQFPGESRSSFEIMLRTDRWPERGLSLTVRLKGKKCVSYQLSEAIRTEVRER